MGLELLDDEVLLDGIQDYDVNKCTTKMFKFWLQRHTSVTWNNLLDALIQIELRDVAIKVVTTIPTFIYRSECIVITYVMIKIYIIYMRIYVCMNCIEKFLVPCMHLVLLKTWILFTI